MSDTDRIFAIRVEIKDEPSALYAFTCLTQAQAEQWAKEKYVREWEVPPDREELVEIGNCLDVTGRWDEYISMLIKDMP